jgi:enoyl-CoA hydratase
MFTSIQLEKKGVIAYLCLNRPERLNAIDMGMLEEIRAALEDLKRDSSITVIIISGNGSKGLSSGADIHYMRSLSPVAFYQFNQYACEVLLLLEELGKVSIAAMHGVTVGGGCELAEACTFRVAEEGAQIGHPEINIGGLAGWGGTTRLPRLIGMSRAVELLLTGKFLSVHEAAELGLVHRIAPLGKLKETAEALAQELLPKSALAIEYGLDAMYRGIEASKRESLGIGAKNSALLSSSRDFIESTEAFIKKHSIK